MLFLDATSHLALLVLSDNSADLESCLGHIIRLLDCQELLGFVQENRIVDILLWKMDSFRQHQCILSSCSEVLVILSSRGSHYDKFIADVSSFHKARCLIEVFNFHPNSSEVCERLALIIQRITQFRPMEKPLAAQCLVIMKQKLEGAVGAKLS